MVTFKHLKIATQLIFANAVVVIFAVTIISLSIGFMVQRQADTQARETAKETAYHYADVVKSSLEEALVQARTLAHLFEHAVTADGLSLTRPLANSILKSFIENNPKVFGVGVVFEPNAFDGKDAEFINAPGHNKTGRFIPYWTRNNQGEGVLEPLVNYDGDNAAEWYTLPKQRRIECVIDPYVYPVQGKPVLMTSLVVPLFGPPRRSQFVGVLSIDLALEELQQRVNHVKVSDFKRAYINFYSSKGMVVVHENSSNIGKSIRETTDNEEFIDHILKNEAFFMERHSKLLNTAVITYGASVIIGKTETPWMVAVNIPKNELTSQATRIIVLTFILGLGIMVVTILAFYFLAKSLVKPLIQISHLLKVLAQGRLSKDEIDYQGRDEIADIVISFRQLRDGMQDTIAQANAIAAGDYIKEIKLRSDQDLLGLALLDMTQKLRTETLKNAQQNWLKTGQTRLNEQLTGEQSLIELAEHIINFLTPYVEAQVGAFYILEDSFPIDAHLKMIASHAYTWRKQVTHQIKLGEGIVGQAALERKLMVITEPPEDYLCIQTGLGESPPQAILVMPCLYENSLKGMLELASLKTFTTIQLEFLTQVMPSIAIAVNTAQSRTKMAKRL